MQVDAHLGEEFFVGDAVRSGLRRGRFARERSIRALDAFVALLKHQPEQFFRPMFVEVLRGKVPLSER